MATTLIKGGIVLLEGEYLKGDILIDGGIIADIGEHIDAAADQTLDAAGCLVMPGFIDGNVCFTAYRQRMADDVLSGTRAAVAGGTTAVLDCIYPEEGQTLLDAANRANAKCAGEISCGYGFHLGIDRVTRTTADEIAEAVKAGFNSFVVTGLDGMPLLIALKAIANAGGIALARCENADFVAAATERISENGRRDIANFPLAHPPLAEAEGISRFLYYAAEAGAAALVREVSTVASQSELRRARKYSKNVYAELCPQQIGLTEEQYKKGGFEAAKYITVPPLRSAADASAMLNACANGECDIFSSGHRSFNQSTQKVFGVNDFTKVPEGLPTVENRADILYNDAVLAGLITDHQFASLMSANAAKLFGLYPKKG